MEILNEMQRKRYKNMSLLTPSQLVKKYNQPLYIKVRRNRDYLKETEYIKSERRTKRKSSKLKKIQEASSKADKEHKFQMRASRLLSKRIQSKTLIPPKPEKILTPEQLEENKIRKARVIGRLLHITKEELQKIMEIPIKSSQPTLSNPRLSQKSILHQKENLISTKSTKKTLTFQEPHKRRGIGGRHNNEFPSKLEKSKSHKSSRSSSKDRKSFLPAGAIVKRPPSKREREQEEKRKVKILQKITRMFNPDLHLPITTPVPALFHTGCLTCGNPNIKVQYHGERHICLKCRQYIRTPDEKKPITLFVDEDGDIQAFAKSSSGIDLNIDINNMKIFKRRCYATFAAPNEMVILLREEPVDLP